MSKNEYNLGPNIPLPKIGPNLPCHLDYLVPSLKVLYLLGYEKEMTDNQVNGLENVRRFMQGLESGRILIQQKSKKPSLKPKLKKRQ